MASKGQVSTVRAKRSSIALTVSALGVVFGDIGTSPLYTLNTVFGLTGGRPTPSDILGIVYSYFGRWSSLSG